MATTTAPIIRRLVIDRFRGIKQLTWHPQSGVNVILGGGDVGKSTVLDAIALLLSPTNAALVTDADFWERKVELGFAIEAVMSLPDSCGINQQSKAVWPWEWNGTEPCLPNVDGDPASANVAEPVYRFRVKGTPEFDLAFEIIQPDDSTDHFSVTLRRKIGLVRLGGDDRNDRDLRLIQGSALDRLLSDKTLRARMGQRVAEGNIEAGLRPEGKANLTILDQNFQSQALPTGLSLGLTGGPGLSLTALIGLTATKASVKLPLASWGAGTRRLAALEIAAAHQGENPVTIVDEIERGLEPCRQRVLMAKLQKSSAQVFLTTHSAAALSAAATATVWYLDPQGRMGRLPSCVAPLQKRDPEAFLARITIIAEGATELGFVTFLLERAFGGELLEHGIWITDAGGNDSALSFLEGLADSGIVFGGFADDEGRFSGRWAAMQSALGKVLFRWQKGCLEENVIRLIPSERLEQFIQDRDGESGARLRTLAERSGLAEKDFATIRDRAPDLTRLIVEAASGAIPENSGELERHEKKALKSHAERWFKSVEGGRELAEKIFQFGVWSQLEAEVMPFLNAIRGAALLPAIQSLPNE